MYPLLRHSFIYFYCCLVKHSYNYTPLFPSTRSCVNKPNKSIDIEVGKTRHSDIRALKFGTMKLRTSKSKTQVRRKCRVVINRKMLSSLRRPASIEVCMDSTFFEMGYSVMHDTDLTERRTWGPC